MSSLFHLPQFIKLWQIFLELNSNRLYKSSGKEKENCCLEFTLSIKRITRKFHDVVVQLRHINGQKSVMHVQSCWFANLNLLLFHRSPWRRRRRCLSSLMLYLSHCQLCIRLSLVLDIMSTDMACYHLYKQELNKLYRHTCQIKDLTRVVQTSG